MPEFLELISPHKAHKIWLKYVEPLFDTEEISSSEALNRITAELIIAPHALPSFSRSTVDGFAVRAKNTYGASGSLPAYFNLVDEVPMGDSPDFSIEETQCATIHTGGMLPAGADAVVMIENTQLVKPDTIEILRPAAVGENVIQIGEEVNSGQEVIPPGITLLPAEIGGLMALGFTRVNVYRKPRIGIISSGDEVISPDGEIRPGQVRDVNSYTLSTLVERSGGVAITYGIVSDQQDILLNKAKKALSECDMVVITAGSSASTRDLTSKVFNQLGKPGVLVHGINIRPGKPTILGICDGKPVVGLPGNPVSAFVIAGLFVIPALNQMRGIEEPITRAYVNARLSVNVTSTAGREDWLPVRITSDKNGEDIECSAEPIFGKSNLIFTLINADGLIRIPQDVTGLEVGEIVKVYLF